MLKENARLVRERRLWCFEGGGQGVVERRSRYDVGGGWGEGVELLMGGGSGVERMSVTFERLAGKVEIVSIICVLPWIPICLSILTATTDSVSGTLLEANICYGNWLNKAFYSFRILSKKTFPYLRRSIIHFLEKSVVEELEREELERV